MTESLPNDEQLPETALQDQARHDVLASLAIANGFSSALGSSYGDLLDTYESIVKSMDSGVADDALEKLKKYENDCKFCLTRLVQSIDRLKDSLDEIQNTQRADGNRPSGELP